MRILGCWLIGSLMLSPMSCGSADSNSANNSSADGNSAKSKASSQLSSTTKTEESEKSTYIDPLVPPIDIGYVPVTSGNAGAGNIDFLPFTEFDFTSDNRAAFHPHGAQVCASGCAASSHPTTELTQIHFKELLEKFAVEPMTEKSESLEELLYFGRQTQRWIAKNGTGPLNSERVAFLRKELSRTHVLVSFRIVDENGVVRTSMPPTRVPLDRRHVFKMEVKDLPPLITSGTVKRTGLHHLWTRL